jgi:hypothetical protein
MDGSSLIVVNMPILILIALFTGIALPFIAASRSGRGHAKARLARADASKRTSAARRKARPPNPGADDAAPVEYLYVPCGHIRDNGYSAETRRRVQQVPIVKKTPKWIYYTSDTWDRTEAVVSPGRVSREEFEADTRRHDNCPAVTRGLRCAEHGYSWDHCPRGEDRCRHGYPAGVIPVPGDRHRPGPAGRQFFATREAAEADLDRRERERAKQTPREAQTVKGLRRAMADAHPDRGGTAEQFIEARRRYETALRSTRW